MLGQTNLRSEVAIPRGVSIFEENLPLFMADSRKMVNVSVDFGQKK